MQATRGRDTRPELALRRELHHRGLRYRVDAPVIPGLRRRANLVFFPRPGRGVRGWLLLARAAREHATTAKSNAAFWAAKITANQARDADTTQRLREAGWAVVRIWEHDTAALAANRVQAVLRRATEAAAAGSVAGPASLRPRAPGRSA